jgi:NAD(P)-dependent dehydrogenase (short-subunit alcohol dehydrogenase family)
VSLSGLDGKAFVIIGGADGIGLAAATRLVAEGARVALVDADAEKLKCALEELQSSDAYAIAADPAVEADVDRSFAEARERFGHIDGLYNDPLVDDRPVSIHDADVATFDRQITGNLRSTFLGLRGLLRVAREQGSSATVVNTSSGVVLRGVPGTALFAAAKSGVVALTQTAAVEAAPTVRVNAIITGPFETPATFADPPEFNAQILARIPLGRFGRPAEAAAIVAWLLSEESSYITGAAYPLDGGEAVS